MLPRAISLSMSGVAGNVEVGEVDGALRLDSVAGNVTLAGARSARIGSVAGRLNMSVGAIESEGIRINSVAGRLDLAFRPDANADVAIDSVIGSVRSESPSLRLYGENQQYRVRVGAGGPALAVSSVAGSVRLRNQ